MVDIQPVGLRGTTEAGPGATPPDRRAVARRGLRTFTRRDALVLGIMVGIPTLVELAFIWLPTIAAIALSFFRWDGLGLNSFHFNGVANYAYAFTNSPSFWPAALHTLIWLLFLGIIGTPLGLLLAVLLDQPIRGSRIYQSIFFVPVMLSVALIGVIWQLFYAPDDGLLNNVLGTAGTSNAVNWFGDSNVNLWAALVAATWRHSGYIMILYLAGLKGVDPSLREAAALDGANERQIFFRVVFPAMAPTNVIIVVITVIESLRAFDIVYVINGATNGLELLSALVVQYLVGEGQVIGIGTAFAVILLVVSLVPIIFYLVRTFGKGAQQ